MLKYVLFKEPCRQITLILKMIYQRILLGRKMLKCSNGKLISTENKKLKKKAFKETKSLNSVSININRRRKGASRKDGYERLRPKFTSY